MGNFIWTDNLVMEFAKVSTQGTYGPYMNMKSIEDKINKFKQLKTMSDNKEQQPEIKLELIKVTNEFGQIRYHIKSNGFLVDSIIDYSEAKRKYQELRDNIVQPESSVLLCETFKIKTNGNNAK